MNLQKLLADRLGVYTDIRLAFLCGSFAEGRQTPASDIDIAILFQKKPDFYYLEEIKDDLARLVKREIDIIVLNESSPIIRMQVLKKGVPLIKHDVVYADYFVSTVKEYDDLKMVRREIEAQILKGRLYA